MCAFNAGLMAGFLVGRVVYPEVANWQLGLAAVLLVLNVYLWLTEGRRP